MSGGTGTQLANQILDHVIGATIYAPLTTLWLALYNVAPTDAGGGTEVGTPGYVRKAVANSSVEWPGATGATKLNAHTQSFVTASASWGTIVAASLMDASTAGSVLFWGTLDQAKVISPGDSATFPAGSISISLT